MLLLLRVEPPSGEIARARGIDGTGCGSQTDYPAASDVESHGGTQEGI